MGGSYRIFNSRFFVPFRLSMINRERVILGTDSMPRLGFTFQDEAGGESADFDADAEKKALYVLNVIFEIQARRRAGLDTLRHRRFVRLSQQVRNYSISQ